MDHFALKSDELAVAYHAGNLRRNFMGYTTLATEQYLGLGVSAIGYVSNCFTQNSKDLKRYYSALDQGQFSIEKGYVLSDKDLINQWLISSLMCQFQIDKNAFQDKFKHEFDRFFEHKHDFLLRCEEENLITLEQDKIVVTDLGRLFVRNICMGFDDYLPQKKKENQFSRTV